MLEDAKRKVIEKIYQDIDKNKSKKIKDQLSKIKMELSEIEYSDVVKSIIHFTLTKSLIMNLNDKEDEKVFLESLKSFMKELPTLKKSFVFSVKLEGFENEINRVIEIPSALSLADLCYSVLSAFESHGNHLFMIKHKSTNYYCDVYEDDYGEEEVTEYASQIHLSQLGLRKNSSLNLWYDFGDNYYFSIKLIEVKEFDNILTVNDVKVHSGSGYGIWEDAHYELDLYYHSHNDFLEYLKENDVDISWYPADENFDLDEVNRSMLEKFYMFKDGYESPDL